MTLVATFRREPLDSVQGTHVIHSLIAEGVVSSIPRRGCFHVVPTKHGDMYEVSPLPAPFREMTRVLRRVGVLRRIMTLVATFRREPLEF